MKSEAELTHPDMFEVPKCTKKAGKPTKAYGPEDFPSESFIVIGANMTHTGCSTIREIRKVDAIFAACNQTTRITFNRSKARSLFLKEPDTTGLKILTDADLTEV